MKTPPSACAAAGTGASAGIAPASKARREELRLMDGEQPDLGLFACLLVVQLDLELPGARGRERKVAVSPGSTSIPGASSS